MKCPGRWAFESHLKKFIGNPRDAVDVMEMVKGVCKTSRSRGDTSKRMELMTMNVLCQLWEFIKFYIMTNASVADEGLHLMAGCASCFLLMVARRRAFSVAIQTFTV